MQSYNSISQLRAKIDEVLLPLIGTHKECVYLDLPFHTNLGDLLIWQGTRDFLNAHHIKCTYCNSIHTNHKMRVKKGQLILMHGGGNFGDVWRDHQEYRCEIIRQYKDHDIVVLPQTVYYGNEESMKVDSEIFASHSNLTICARDSWSYEYLKTNFKANNIFLCPDMAFYISNPKINVSQTDKILCVIRDDHESSDELVSEMQKELLRLSGEDVSKIEVSDWPTIVQDCQKVFAKYYNWLFFKKLRALFSNPEKEILDRYMLNWYLYVWLCKWSKRMAYRLDGFTNRWMWKNFLNPIWQIGNEFVGGRKMVVTNRLHVCILCTLLEKECHLYDNNYGKNSHFYDTWLSNFDKSVLMRKS